MATSWAITQCKAEHCGTLYKYTFIASVFIFVLIKPRCEKCPSCQRDFPWSPNWLSSAVQALLGSETLLMLNSPLFPHFHLSSFLHLECCQKHLYLLPSQPTPLLFPLLSKAAPLSAYLSAPIISKLQSCSDLYFSCLRAPLNVVHCPQCGAICLPLPPPASYSSPAPFPFQHLYWPAVLSHIFCYPSRHTNNHLSSFLLPLRLSLPSRSLYALTLLSPTWPFSVLAHRLHPSIPCFIHHCWASLCAISTTPMCSSSLWADLNPDTETRLGEV